MAHSLVRDFDAELAAFGIRTAHLGVLSSVRAYGPLAQRRLAEYLGIERQTVVNVVDDLERRGLVRREPVPRDRRVSAVQLTDDGRAFHDQVDAAAQRHEQRVYGALLFEERDQFVRLLGKLARHGHFDALFAPPDRERHVGRGKPEKP